MRRVNEPKKSTCTMSMARQAENSGAKLERKVFKSSFLHFRHKSDRPTPVTTPPPYHHAPRFMFGISCNKKSSPPIVRMYTSKAVIYLSNYFLTTPSSALKQSSKFLECLLVACSVSILRAVVLWKDWKHVLHLTDCAAAFYNVCQNMYTWLRCKRSVHTPTSADSLPP